MDLWWESHPIPNPEVGFDITQLCVSQHGIKIADTDLGPVLVLVLVVQSHGSPSSAQPRALNQPIITELQLGQERVDFRLILKEEPKTPPSSESWWPTTPWSQRGPTKNSSPKDSMVS